MQLLNIINVKKLRVNTVLFLILVNIYKLNNFFLPIMCNSSCKSVNIIYILYCCESFHYYIGETINFKERFNKHKRNILINNTEIDEAFDDGVSLVKHFQKDHYFKTDLKFFIFKTNITEKNDR